MRNGRKWIVGVCCVLVTALLSAGIYHILREQQWNEALAALERDIGQYDDHSIVLQNTTKQDAQRLAECYGAKLRITQDGTYARLMLPEDLTIRDVFRMKESRADIEKMSADYMVQTNELTEDVAQERIPTRPSFSCIDEYYPRQTYLDYMNFGSVWTGDGESPGVTGKGITVAVIDTGIDTDHPEFAGRISEYSYNATDDRVVRDTLLENGDYDWSVVEDQQGHGTMVAGVLAAAVDGSGIVGVAPEVEILAIKAESDANGRFQRTSDLVFAIYYAIERDVDVINMSFGGSGSYNPYAAAIQLAVDSDIICVAAAGNDSADGYCWPAADDNVLAVGALGDGWELADYSNYGDNLDIVAPGSTLTTQIGGGYKMAGGTSLASPLVAGTMALLRQMHGVEEVSYVKEQVFASAYDLGTPGRDWTYGFGAIDVSALLWGLRGNVEYEMLTDEVENQRGLYIYGHTLQQMPEPERLYAIFDGWYYDSAFTQEFGYYEDKIHSDITLYAKWVNEEDGVPFTYAVLEDGTVEIRSYTGHRKYVTVPEKIDGKTVSSIGANAFEEERSIKRVLLPSGIINIGERAFFGCSALMDMEIPARVTQIGQNAFCGCSRLASVVFSGENLHTIGMGAFSYCYGLKRISLPASLEEVDGSAFCGAMFLESIEVSPGNASFCSLDGVLLSVDRTAIVAYPAAKGTQYALPAGVKHIGTYAFAYAKLEDIELTGITQIGESAFSSSALREVVIPDSVTKMGSGVFSGCSYLSRAEIGAGIEELPGKTFAYSALSKAEIPATIKKIGEESFLKCIGLWEITFSENSQLEAIGSSAFSGTSLSEIDLPATVTSIEMGAFMESAISQVYFEEGSNLQKIGQQAFAECYNLNNITLPDTLLKIDNYAFSNAGLNKISLPASVNTLGAGVFACCKNMTEISVDPRNESFAVADNVLFSKEMTQLYTYPAGLQAAAYVLPDTVRVLMPAGFMGNEWVEQVMLPEAMEEIRYESFAFCTGLKAISVPDNVTHIGRQAFTYDAQLQTVSFGENSKLTRLGYASFFGTAIDSIRIPASVTSMSQGVFAGCDQLWSVTFAQNSKLETITAYMFEGSNVQTVTFEQGSTLKTIQAHGFDGASNLWRVNFGDAKLETVGNFAFAYCRRISDLTLPDTVQEIGRYAFYACVNMDKLTVPASVARIGSYAFLGTKKVELYFKSETMPDRLDDHWDHGVGSYYSGVTKIAENDEFRYANLSSGSIAVLKYLGGSANVDLTQVDLGGNITVIGGSAFADTAVTSVTLPDSLTAIQAEAFRDARIRKIHIPSGVKFIGRQAFAYTPLEEVIFGTDPCLTVIEREAFLETDSLTRITIPASVTSLGIGVFRGSGLSELTFEEGSALTLIPEEAFADTKLGSVVLPNQITRVDHYAFHNVQSLKTVSFGTAPNMYLMSNAFYNTGLTQLHIPENVVFIGEFCFTGLKSLEAFTVAQTNPVYTAVDGLLVTKDGRKLVAVPAGRTGSLSVPVQIESIGFGAFESTALSQVHFDSQANILSLGYRAFYNAQNLTSITVPASVVAMDYYAFGYCQELREVQFSEGTRLMGIYEGVFCGDIRLESIVLPEQIAEIAEFSFYSCSSLDTIPVKDPLKLTYIGDYAFAYSGLSGALTVPENVTWIGAGAFMGCDLTDVTVSDIKQHELILGLGVFEDCDRLQSLTVPFVGQAYDIFADYGGYMGALFGAGNYEASAAYLPKSLKTITLNSDLTVLRDYAFYGLPESVELVLSDRITRIEYGAFYECAARHTIPATVTYFRHVPVSYEMYCSDLYIGTGIYGKLTLSDEMTELCWAPFRDCTNLEEVILPQGITELPEEAFRNCTGLKRVELPKGMTSINDYAFYNCTALESITLPEKLTNLGEQAFFNCESLRFITIPEAVTQIRYATFMNCGALKQAVLHDGVVAIEDSAFCDSGLESFVVPQKLTTVGDDAFSWCNSLHRVTNRSDLPLTIGSNDYGGLTYYAQVLTDKEGNITYRQNDEEDDGNVYLITQDQFRFRIDGDAYVLTDYLGDEETVILPESVNGQAYDIQYFKGGKHIVIPESFTQIPEYAFYGNETILSVTIPDTVIDIGNNAFDGCVSLAAVDFGQGLQRIGNSTFSDCKALKEVILPDTLYTLENYAFGGCTGIETLLLGARVYYVSGLAFAQVDRIETVTLSSENPWLVMKDGVIYDKGMTRLVAALPGVRGILYLPETLETIEDFGLSGQTELTGVMLPECLSTIGSGAFSDCTGLSEIDLPKHITSIDASAFSGCSGLTEMVIPDSVQALGSSVFFNCIALRSVTLPGGLTVLPSYLFYGCKSLTGVTIPESVTEVEWAAFMESGLVSIRLPDGMKTLHWGTFQNCEDLRSVELPGSLMAINREAFRNCTSLEELEIPEGTASIGDSAFQGMWSLCSIKLPNSLTTIGKNVFDGCVALEYVDLGSGLNKLSDNLFRGLTNLKEVTIPEGVTEIGSYTFAQTGLETVTIPDSVTTIRGYAFSDCDALRSVHMGTGVKVIENWAFLRSYDVNELHIKDLASWCGVSLDIFDCHPLGLHGGNMYLNGQLLTDLVIPESISYVGQNTFSNCNSIRSVTIESYTTSVGSGAFSGCENLALLNLPKGWTTLPGAFSGCVNLRSVRIPETVTRIDDVAFTNCSSLMDVNIPEGVESIGWRAFGYCTNLTGITIPSSMQSIEDEAFVECKNLYEIVNHSDLALSIGGEDNGYVARHAKVIEDSSGNRIYKDSESGFCIVDTPDNFRFIYEYGMYTLISYFGEKDNITLPENILGNSYTIRNFQGGRHVTIPGTISSVPEYAFQNSVALESVTFANGVEKIQYKAFLNCHRLKNVVVGDSVTLIASCAFENCTALKTLKLGSGLQHIHSSAFLSCTSLFDNPENWHDGIMMIDGWVLDVEETLVYHPHIRNVRGVAADAYQGCDLLKTAVWSDAAERLSNAETLYITRIHESTYQLQNNRMINVVICDSVDAGDLQKNPNLFFRLRDSVIYVEKEEADLRWDVLRSGWNYGNAVVYGDQWITAEFYDHEGVLLRMGVQKISQVLRRPVLRPEETASHRYYFVGWDLDGDGVEDVVPATSVSDVVARAVVRAEEKRYTVSFQDPDNGKQIFTQQLLYGQQILPPADPAEAGKVFLGWQGWYDGMTILQDTVIYARWHTHVYGARVVLPTCVDQGYTVHACICGDSYKDTFVSSNGHSYADWYETQSVTCLQNGWLRRDCDSCTHYETQEVITEGHILADWTVYQAASCVSEGEERRECQRCNYYGSRTIPKRDHSYYPQVIQPTCTEQGYTRYSCSCGIYYDQNYVSANGHSMGSWVMTDMPTCVSEGWHVKKCDNCSYFESGPVPAYGHQYDTVVTPPTCNDDGYTTHTCRKCGSIDVTDPVSATGHTFGDWICNLKPTCTTYGQQHRICSSCTIKEYESVDPTGHSYQTEVIAPTCINHGYTVYRCACGDFYRDDHTEKLGHDYGPWKTEKEPTCTVAGTEVRGCIRCSIQERKELLALGHSFTAYISDGNATEFSDGTKTAVCDNGCGTKDTVQDHGSKLPPQKISSDTFLIENGFVTQIAIGTTIENLLNSIQQDNVQVFHKGVAVQADAKAATGMQLQLLSGGTVVDTVTLVVTGDINGDGNITVTDMLSVKAHLLKKSTLTGVFADAADTSGDEAISITDFIQIKAHILGKSQIKPL